MIGKLWSTGIVLKYDGSGGWWATAHWQDEGHCTDGSVWLKIGTSYAAPIQDAIDMLIQDAASLGLEFAVMKYVGTPRLYIENEENPFAPDDWREILQAQARRIGWKTYEQRLAPGELDQPKKEKR